MDRELVAIGQQLLNHRLHLLNIGFARYIRNAIDVVTILVEPGWPTYHLLPTEPIGKLDEVIHGVIFDPDMASLGTESIARVIGLAKLDGRNLKCRIGIRRHPLRCLGDRRWWCPRDGK